MLIKANIDYANKISSHLKQINDYLDKSESRILHETKKVTDEFLNNESTKRIDYVYDELLFFKNKLKSDIGDIDAFIKHAEIQQELRKKLLDECDEFKKSIAENQTKYKKGGKKCDCKRRTIKNRK